MVMRDGQIQRQVEDGTVDVLDFDRYVLPLEGEVEVDEIYYLKASDRSLYELLFPDRTAHYDQRNIEQFEAEAHARLSSPLLSIALAMIALVGVLAGQFSRQGYGRRIMIAAAVALVVRLLALGVTAAASDDPDLNALQYILPLAVILTCSIMLGGKGARRKRHSLGPSVLAAES
jgi:lipopolysaccharide export system permease protein